jgi:hypothetical protein
MLCIFDDGKIITVHLEISDCDNFVTIFDIEKTETKALGEPASSRLWRKRKEV